MAAEQVPQPIFVAAREDATIPVRPDLLISRHPRPLPGHRGRRPSARHTGGDASGGGPATAPRRPDAANRHPAAGSAQRIGLGVGDAGLAPRRPTSTSSRSTRSSTSGVSSSPGPTCGSGEPAGYTNTTAVGIARSRSTSPTSTGTAAWSRTTGNDAASPHGPCSGTAARLSPRPTASWLARGTRPACNAGHPGRRIPVRAPRSRPAPPDLAAGPLRALSVGPGHVFGPQSCPGSTVTSGRRRGGAPGSAEAGSGRSGGRRRAAAA